MAIAKGARLGPYEVLELLGAGGMGEVYRARDPRLGRDVAVKLIRGEETPSPERLKRFETEARAAAALNHPNILTVHDVGTHEGTPYVVTELLEGENLRELVSRRSPSVKQILSYALQAARGLEAAHAKGIVHRDLKPENLFLTTDGRVKILDFGLAKLRQQDALALESSFTTESVTAVNQVVGTVAYMSPEQARGHVVDARSDVFSFGVVLYQLLAGRHPFRMDTPAATLTAIVEQTPVALESLSPGVPPAVGRIVRRCLEKAREDRYPSGRDVAVALETVLAVPTEAAALRDLEERSPYPGLSAFTEKDAGVFFGRERAVEELWGRIRNRRLLAVIGPSGAGKTSFVRAGVLAGRPEGWGAIVCPPGAAPFRALGQALVREMAGDVEALERIVSMDDAPTAFEVLRRWRKGHGEALVVLDQLEELFTLNPPEVQERFARLLGRLATDADVHVLLSLRDDFLMRCHDHEPLVPVFSELTPLGALSREALLRAITEPAKKRGYRFEDEALVDEMVQAVEGARAALPLLAFAVSRLWQKRDRDRKLLTRAAYEEIGGVAGALAQHAEQTLERIGSERQAIVREIFRNLVTSQGTRAAAEREELLSVCPDRETAGEVLDALIDARLLTSFEVAREEVEAEAEPPEDTRKEARYRIEVAHESLLKAWPRLVRWQAQDEEGAVLRDQLRQAAHLWEEKGRSDDLLWTGTAYQEYELWRQRYAGALTAAEERFADAMVEHVERARRRRRVVTTSVAAALLAGLAITSALWHRSEVSRRRAESSNLVALGRAEIDRHPTAALAYARASLEVADTSAGRRLALEALWRGPTARILPLGDENAPSAEFSPDGRWLAVRPYAESLLLFPDDGGEPRVFGPLPAPSGTLWAELTFTRDGSALLTPAQREDGSAGVQMYSVPDGRELRWLEFDLAAGTLCGWEYLRDGILVCFRQTSEPDALLRLELVPHDGGPSRVVGSLRGVDSNWADREGSRLALARGQRISVRPIAGGPTTAEREVARIEGGRVLHPLFTPRGDALAIVQEAGQLTLLPLDQGEEVSRRPRVLHMDKPDPAFFPTLDAGETRLVWGSSEGTVSLWRLDGPPDAEPVVLRRGAVANTTGGTLHPDGDWTAVANDLSVTFWPLDQPQPFVLRGHERKIWQVSFTADSKWLVSSDRDGVRMWPLDPGTGTPRTFRIDEELGNCNGFALGPDTERMLVVGFKGVHLVSLSGGDTRVLSDRFPDGGGYGPALDAAGRRAAAASSYSPSGAPKRLRVWDLGSSDPPRELPLAPPGETEEGFDFGVHQLAFTPQGHLLAAGERGIRRFDPASGESEWIWRLDRSWVVSSMASSRDARRLVATAFLRRGAEVQDHPVVLFDLAEGDRRSITSHGNRVVAVALDPSGTILVTGDEDGIVRVGPADGGEPQMLLGHTGAMDMPGYRVAVSPDGRWIASAAGTEIRLWPMPDVAKPPLHTLPHDELMAKLDALTNLRVVRDAASSTGWRLEIGPFPGWRDSPIW